MKTGMENGSAITLMYHDVVDRETHQASGFPSADAALYKLDPEQFDRHLAAIREAVGGRPIRATELGTRPNSAARPWMLTFDDGGRSFHTRIVDRIEALGWPAHFFITTDYIGDPAFMTPEEIRDLHRRGHVIGSHSCSHPLRFAARPFEELRREWRESLRVLAELLGEPVRTASIPGGQYSRRVAEAAAAEGIEVLFTSEPTTRFADVDGCLVIGRYAIQRWMGPEVAAGMAAGRFSPRFRQWFWWETKKIVKTLGGNVYLKLRESMTGGLS